MANTISSAARAARPAGGALAVAALVVGLSGCAGPSTPAAGGPPSARAEDSASTRSASGPSSAGSTSASAASAPGAPSAIVDLSNRDGEPGGRATLRQTADGVEIAIEVAGLARGRHGFHIHSHGVCAPGPDAASGRIVYFGAAGPHFDPGTTRNHGRPGESSQLVHAGDLPHIEVGSDGQGSLRYTNPNVTLSPGKTSVMGRTLVVHESADDYETDPAGNTGARLLCGEIEPAAAGAVHRRAFFEGSQVFPEGIAVDTGDGSAYVGSTAEGHIYRIVPGREKAELFQTGGSPGRMAAYGMKIDERRRLWVAGGHEGTVAVVDLPKSATVAVLETPPDSHGFLNDLVITSRGAVFVTDSFRPVLYRVDSASGTPALEAWLDLRTTPIRYRPNAFNLNGIVASPDGSRLLAIQSVTGQLWRIDTATKAVTEVAIEGGALRNGDGLVLVGERELYVVRNREDELVQLALNADWTRGRVAQRLTDPRLKYPTTAALDASGLLVVNAQTDKQQDPPPLLPFDVVNIKLPR